MKKYTKIEALALFQKKVTGALSNREFAKRYTGDGPIIPNDVFYVESTSMKPKQWYHPDSGFSIGAL